MEIIIDSISTQFVAFAPSFGGVLVTLLILIIGIKVAGFISKFFGKALHKLKLNEKLNSSSDTQIDFVKSISMLIYYVVVLNVLLIVLERLHITSVLDPLKNLSNQFLSTLPRIIGAGIIFYAGWIIAKLCSSFVELAAKKLDDYIEAKGFQLGFKTSKFLAAFILGAILLPIVVAGFDFLDIRAISEPAINMINSFMAAVPNIVGAGLILLVSYFIAKFIVYMLTGLLDGMSVNQLPEKMHFKSLMPKDTSFSDFIGKIVMFFIMLTATTAAIEKLNIPTVSEIFSRLVHFASGVVLGGVILLVGTFLANFAHQKLKANSESSSLAGIARFAILGLVLAMGLKAMGLADHIVNMAFGLTFGAVAASAAIAFGVGGIEAAKTLTANWVQKVKK